MDADASEVLASARSRTATLAEAHVLLDAIMSQAPDDLTHVRHGAETDVVLVAHAGEKQPRAVIMSIEYYRKLIRTLANKEKPPRRKRTKR